MTSADLLATVLAGVGLVRAPSWSKGIRTPDPLPAEQVLYQLSYSPSPLGPERSTRWRRAPEITGRRRAPARAAIRRCARAAASGCRCRSRRATRSSSPGRQGRPMLLRKPSSCPRRQCGSAVRHGDDGSGCVGAAPSALWTPAARVGAAPPVAGARTSSPRCQAREASPSFARMSCATRPSHSACVRLPQPRVDEHWLAQDVEKHRGRVVQRPAAGQMHTITSRRQGSEQPRRLKKKTRQPRPRESKRALEPVLCVPHRLPMPP